MADRRFTVHPFDNGFSLVCYDQGCAVGGGFYLSFDLPKPFEDDAGALWRDAGLCGAVLDGRRFVATGLIP